MRSVAVDETVEMQVATQDGHVQVRSVRNGRPSKWVELAPRRANELAHLLNVAAVEAQQGRRRS